MNDCIIVEARENFVTIRLSEVYCVRMPKVWEADKKFFCVIFMMPKFRATEEMYYTVTLESANAVNKALGV